MFNGQTEVDAVKFNWTRTSGANSNIECKLWTKKKKDILSTSIIFYLRSSILCLLPLLC